MQQDNHELEHAFTSFLLATKALKFGDFTLKSGRQSPYFINAGAFYEGASIATLGDFYAQTILRAQDEEKLPKSIDTVFGPAYKGIPLAVSTAIALHQHGYETSYTFDRKERKDHGDGGMLVGKPLADGMNVLLVDDVMTAGTAVREVVPKLLKQAQVHIVGLVLSVDRMEQAPQRASISAASSEAHVLQAQRLSAVRAVEQEFGFPVIPIATMQQIFAAARNMRDADNQPIITPALQQRIDTYTARYGVRQ